MACTALQADIITFPSPFLPTKCFLSGEPDWRTVLHVNLQAGAHGTVPPGWVGGPGPQLA